jgi:membrane-bound lytic murein transglycosylase MltF
MNSPDRQAVESASDKHEKWSGNFDGMVERHLIRVLVPYSKTFYFLDGADQRGLTYEAIQAFEKHLNRQLEKQTLKIRVVVIPTSRDRLLSGLAEGLGDIAAGNLTITPDRLKLVEFADPGYTGVDEIIVTGPKSPSIKTLYDLAGREIHVRRSSSYYESLVALNKVLKKRGRKQVKIVPADEYLEDEDILEMMNAGLIPMTVIDSHKGKLWGKIFKDLKLHPDLKVRTVGEIAWAIRKKSPKLKDMINGFVKEHRVGTLFGNILFNRYFKNTKWVRNSLTDEELNRFKKAVDHFKKYSEQYDFDWLMIAALAYQESGIDQGKRSPSGAIGVMQLLPSTAADPNVAIPNIEQMGPNIHAGVKYLRFIRNRYFEAEPMDNLNKTLFSFASYNAGPARVARLRTEADNAGLDRNVWFRNVETLAAKHIGRETVQYVANIYKYYTAYRLIVDKLDLKQKAKQRMGGKSKEESVRPFVP